MVCPYARRMLVSTPTSTSPHFGQWKSVLHNVLHCLTHSIILHISLCVYARSRKVYSISTILLSHRSILVSTEVEGKAVFRPGIRGAGLSRCGVDKPGHVGQVVRTNCCNVIASKGNVEKLFPKIYFTDSVLIRNTCACVLKYACFVSFLCNNELIRQTLLS